LAKALPEVGDLLRDQIYPEPRPEIYACCMAFASELDLDTSDDAVRQAIGIAVETGYACRRVEERMCSAGDAAPLLTFLMTGHTYAEGKLDAAALLHREATAFALGLTTEATGPLSYMMLPALHPFVRAKLAARTVAVAPNLYNSGELPAGVTAKQLLQCWEYGFVLRYAEMSLPDISFIDYGHFRPRNEAADLQAPPPGIQP
jgi:hypothetical protein